MVTCWYAWVRLQGHTLLQQRVNFVLTYPLHHSLAISTWFHYLLDHILAIYTVYQYRVDDNLATYTEYQYRVDVQGYEVIEVDTLHDQKYVDTCSLNI